MTEYRLANVVFGFSYGFNQGPSCLDSWTCIIPGSIPEKHGEVQNVEYLQTLDYYTQYDDHMAYN